MSTTAFAMTMKNDAYMTVAMITGRSRFSQRVVGQLADAGQAEDDLREQRAAGDQRAEVEAEEADERDHRGAQDVPEQHALLGQALRARGAHEILVLRLDHARAQHAPVEADVEHREREPREDQLHEPAATGPP